VPERLNGAVSKTVVGLYLTQGSNPCLSAISDWSGSFARHCEQKTSLSFKLQLFITSGQGALTYNRTLEKAFYAK
jgi:hypothetical protein